MVIHDHISSNLLLEQQRSRFWVGEAEQQVKEEPAAYPLNRRLTKNEICEGLN
jgi:hypothetical protein